MSCGVGHRCSLDVTVLWLWRRLAVTASIQPLAWEPPYAAGAALKKKKKKKRPKKITSYSFTSQVVIRLKWNNRLNLKNLSHRQLLRCYYFSDAGSFNTLSPLYSPLLPALGFRCCHVVDCALVPLSSPKVLFLTPVASGRSQAGDQTCTTAVTWATAMTTLDP